MFKQIYKRVKFAENKRSWQWEDVSILAEFIHSDFLTVKLGSFGKVTYAIQYFPMLWQPIEPDSFWSIPLPFARYETDQCRRNRRAIWRVFDGVKRVRPCKCNFTSTFLIYPNNWFWMWTGTLFLLLLWFCCTLACYNHAVFLSPCFNLSCKAIGSTVFHALSPNH